MIGSGSLENGLYYIKLVPSGYHTINCNNTIADNHPQAISSFDVWHYRLGHLSSHRLMILNEKILYLKIQLPSNHDCDIYHFAKQRRLPYSLSPNNASQIFELIHFDIWGPFGTTFIHGHQYFLTVLDDYSRYTWIYLLKSK